MTEPYGTDDDLRDALARLDPVPPTTPLAPLTDRQVHEMTERAMSSTEPTPATGPSRSGGRRTGLVAAAAVAVLAVGGIGTYALVGGADPTATGGGGSTLALDLAAGDPFASCLRPDAAGLANFPVAFAGTVTEVTPETVTVDVTRWYVGGDADVVTLAGTGASAALTGVEFAGGESVLVSASDGTVSSCGYSGTAGPELQALYDEAFAG